MQKIMFAAILSIALLSVGVVANSYHFVPSADAVKSKGTTSRTLLVSQTETDPTQRYAVISYAQKYKMLPHP